MPARATDRWLTKCFDTEGQGLTQERGERKKKRGCSEKLQLCRCQVRRAKRVDGRFSLAGKMVPDMTSIDAVDFQRILPCIKYSFSKNISRNILVYVLFLCFLFAWKIIYIFFRNIFEKYLIFSKLQFRSIFVNVKSEKKTISVERKYLKSRYLEGKSNLEKIIFSFYLLSKKRSRFKSIFIVKSSGKIIVHARSHAKKLPLLLLFRSSRKKENKKKRKNIRDPNASISSFYSPVSRSDRVISCSGWQFRVRRG